MGVKSRKSLKQFNNDYLLLKWIIIFLSVWQGDDFYGWLRNQDKKITNLEDVNLIIFILIIKIIKLNPKNILEINFIFLA